MGRTRPERIHIIGSIGSGKTTLAKKLSIQLNIPFYELDNVVWQRTKNGDYRRSVEKRDEYLSEIVHSPTWIIEGVHHNWVSPAFREADIILFLDTGMTTRRIRIIQRYVRQKAGIEKANYKPTLRLLKNLYDYNTVFEYKHKPEILDLLKPYDKKLVILKGNADIINHFN